MFNEYYDVTTRTYSTNPSYMEILKLDKMLTEADIPHTLDRFMDGWQICYPCRMHNSIVMDAIEHYGSYGNCDDKLEIMGLLIPEEAQWDSVVGWLTAEDVFERIRKHHNGEWNAYIKSLPATIFEEDHDETLEESSSDTAPMTPNEFAAKMQEAYETHYVKENDEEVVHIVMDGIMCDLLRQLGYGEGIDIFNNTPMWYA